MQQFAAFFLLIISFIVKFRLKIVECSFSKVMMVEYENDVSWEKPWVHSTTKRGGKVEDDWKRMEIVVHYLEGQPGQHGTADEWNFVRKVVDELFVITRQLLLQVRKHDQHKILIPRQCVDGKHANVYGSVRSVHCQNNDSCSEFGLCYEMPVPREHSGGCWKQKGDGSFEEVYPDGAGVAGDLIVYIAILDCKPELANAIGCQTDPQYRRPMAGRIAVCKHAIKKHLLKPIQLTHILLHELFHILVSGSMASGAHRYRFHNGTTRMEVRTRVKREWNSASGSFTREAVLSTLPSVVKYVREHFDCPDLEGAELDNSTSEQKQYFPLPDGPFAHFEARLFPDSILSPVYIAGVELSKLDVALINDTGWYKVNESMGRHLTVTRGKGCDFARLSCYDYMKKVNFDRRAMYPYCDMNDETKWMCSLDNKQTGYCSGDMSEDTVGAEFHIQTSAMKFLGQRWAEFCPMVIPRWVGGDSSPYCRESHRVDYRAIGTEGGHMDNQCVRVETLNVKGSKKCPKVKEKNRGICVTTVCTPDSMIFHLGGKNFTCSKSDSGQRLNFDFESTPNECQLDGTFCCPDYESFCPAFGDSTTSVIRFEHCSAFKFSSNLFIYIVALLNIFFSILPCFL